MKVVVRLGLWISFLAFGLAAAPQALGQARCDLRLENDTGRTLLIRVLNPASPESAYHSHDADGIWIGPKDVKSLTLNIFRECKGLVLYEISVIGVWSLRPQERYELIEPLPALRPGESVRSKTFKANDLSSGRQRR